jgi:hypothetical protein
MYSVFTALVQDSLPCHRIEKTMAIGISPLVDHAFKRLLGNEKHPRITTHFLNAVLTEQPRITQVQILNPVHDRQNSDDKLSVLDILAIDELGRLLNIEVQTWLPYGMAQRLSLLCFQVVCQPVTEGPGLFGTSPVHQHLHPCRTAVSNPADSASGLSSAGKSILADSH